MIGTDGEDRNVSKQISDTSQNNAISLIQIKNSTQDGDILSLQTQINALTCLENGNIINRLVAIENLDKLKHLLLILFRQMFKS